MVNADQLSPASRDFFERTRMKMVASLVIASTGLMILGFASNTGGLAAYWQDYLAAGNVPPGTNYQRLIGGYGFACFVFIIGAILCFILAVIISPLLCGTPYEKKVVWGPKELNEMEGDAFLGADSGVDTGAAGASGGAAGGRGRSFMSAFTAKRAPSSSQQQAQSSSSVPPAASASAPVDNRRPQLGPLDDPYGEWPQDEGDEEAGAGNSRDGGRSGNFTAPRSPQRSAPANKKGSNDNNSNRRGGGGGRAYDPGDEDEEEDQHDHEDEDEEDMENIKISMNDD